MATPVNDTYSTASGGTIYGGTDNLPSWLPNSGEFGYVSLSSGTGSIMSSVFDTTNPQPLLQGGDGAAILNVWCSTIDCPGWGTMGGIAAWGGGHNDRVNNDMYMYDKALQRWFRIVDATPLGIELKDDGVCYGNKVGLDNGVPAWVSDPAFTNVWGEYWTDATRSAIKVGKVGAVHTYGNIKYVPGSAYGNTQGAVVLMGGAAYLAHSVDLDNLEAGWQRCGDLFTTVLPGTKTSSYGCTIWDSLRSRLFCYPSNNGGQDGSLILNFPSKTVATTSNNFIDSYYHQGRYAAADDMYLVFSNDYPNRPKVKVLHPTSGAKYTPTQSGITPPPLYSMEWDEARRRLVGFDGFNSTLYFGQAPENMATGTWVWTSETFTNLSPVVPQTESNGMFDRVHFDANLQAFFIVTRVNGPVQCWKI